MQAADFAARELLGFAKPLHNSIFAILGFLLEIGVTLNIMYQFTMLIG